MAYRKRIPGLETGTTTARTEERVAQVMRMIRRLEWSYGTSHEALMEEWVVSYDQVGAYVKEARVRLGKELCDPAQVRGMLSARLIEIACGKNAVAAVQAAKVFAQIAGANAPTVTLHGTVHSLTPEQRAERWKELTGSDWAPKRVAPVIEVKLLEPEKETVE